MVGITGKLEKVSDVYFPDQNAKQGDREKLWQYSSDLKRSILPNKDHIHAWSEVIWPETHTCDLEDTLKDFSQNKSLSELIKKLQLNRNDAIKWINSYIIFILEMDDSISIFNKNKLLPDQSSDGVFRNRLEVHNDKIIETKLPLEIDLKKIFLALGWTCYPILKMKEIGYSNCNGSLDTDWLAKKITDKFDDIGIDQEKKNKAIQMLIQWFDHNRDLGKDHFPKLYRNKEKLLVDTIDDKDSLYKIMRSSVPLKELSDIAISMEDDPDLIKLIEKRREEKRESVDNTIVGEKIEKLLQEAFQDEDINVENTWIGKDLIITFKNALIKYDIEVKSTVNHSYVGMTPTQAKTAALENQKYYALCVVHKDGSKISKSYVRNTAKFVTNIGVILEPKVIEVEEMVNVKNSISNTNEDIDLLIYNDFDYRYGISDSIWGAGKGFDDFVAMIRALDK